MGTPHLVTKFLFLRHACGWHQWIESRRGGARHGQLSTLEVLWWHIRHPGPRAQAVTQQRRGGHRARDTEGAETWRPAPNPGPGTPAPAAPCIRPRSAAFSPGAPCVPTSLLTAPRCPARTPQRVPRPPVLPAALGSGADPGESPSVAPFLLLLPPRRDRLFLLWTRL